jgi:hypothetical protein
VRQSREYRNGLAIAGLLAAVALAVRGFMELRHGTGWPMLLGAAGLVVAIALRRFVFRD